MLSSVLALTAAIAIGTPSVEPLAELSMGTFRGPDLALHLGTPGPDAGAALALEEGPRHRKPTGPVCSGDVCEPMVSVPGYEPSYGRAHRSEAFVALLTRMHVEPLATVAWAFLATGLRFDYTPVVFEGANSGGHGWGSLSVRLRLRLDAKGDVVVPPRPR